MTIPVVTRSLAFDVEGPSASTRDPFGNVRVGLAVTAKINRKDFGLAWNMVLGAGRILVGNEVTIRLDVHFIRS